MATQRFWEDSPLAALTRVRARRQLQDLPGSRLWPALAASLSFAAWNWLEPTHYTALLSLAFLLFFIGLPAYLNGRDLAQLRALRQGRCLEEMLAVGLTPQSVADTLAFSSWSVLARLTSWCWLGALVPLTFGSLQGLFMGAGLALPLGLGLMALTVYLRQVLLLLADDPNHLLRQGLRVYGQACLCLALPLWIALSEDFTAGSLMLLPSTALLLVWVRRRAVALWRQDLDPHKAARPATDSWGAWMIPWVSNPILIRELRSSRGHSLFLWLGLPLLVLGAVGLALPPMIKLFGPGLGFYALWLGWRLLNHSVLSQRSRELVQSERQAGSWELLVQVGMGGPQFVQGWAQATAFRHFGWMLADLLGLLTLAASAPQWMLPEEMTGWAPLWAISLWGLGLLLDWAGFMAGLAAQTRSLLPAWVVATGIGELFLVLWMEPGSSLHTFLWSQGLPTLALLGVAALALGQAYRGLGPALDPVRGARSSALGLDLLPRRVAQVSWCLWLLTTPALASWRHDAGWGIVLLALAGGSLVWGWLMQPLAWAVGNNLRIGSDRWVAPLLFGQVIAWLSATPVVLAAEARNLYWLSTGSTWLDIQNTAPLHDLPLALMVASATALIVQLQRLGKGEKVETSGAGLRLAALGAAGLCLGGAAVGSLNKIYPSQLTPSEQRWLETTANYHGMSHAQWDEKYSAFYDRIADHKWVDAVDLAIELERARIDLDSQGYAISGEPFSELLDTLSSEPPTRAEAEQMVKHLETAIKNPQEQLAQDAEMRRSLDAAKRDEWWGPALRLAQLREYMRRSGHMEVAPPAWVQHHPAYYPNLYVQTSQMQAEMAVLNHRLRMRLGDSEWPGLYMVNPGQVFLVTQDGQGYTDYWLARANETPVTVKLGKGKERQIPAVHVATIAE